MITSTYADELSHVADLLQAASEYLWEAADTAGVGTGVESLALGASLVAAQAQTAAGAAGGPIRDTVIALEGAAGREAGVRLLTEAEEALRAVPGDVAGVSELVVTLSDLLREATGG